VQSALFGVGEVDRRRVRGLENRLVVLLERPPGREAPQAKRADRGDRRAGTPTGPVEKDVRANPEKCQKRDEADEDRARPLDVALLLLVDVGGNRQVLGPLSVVLCQSAESLRPRTRD